MATGPHPYDGLNVRDAAVHGGESASEDEPTVADPPPADNLGSMTFDELYEHAKVIDLPGRSNMDKDELLNAIRATGED